MGYGIGAVADQDESMVDEAGQLQDKVDNTIKTFMHNATEEFGFAPRDVYNGIFNHAETRWEHTSAIRWIKHSSLETIVRTFCLDGELDGFSERVFVVYPRPYMRRLDGWAIDFKSVQIGREVMESMRLQDGKHLRELYEWLRKLKEASPLARWVFEAIARGTTEL